MMDILLKSAKKYKNLVILNAGAIGERKCEKLEKHFPDRCFSFGLSEANMVSAAAGFALTGKLPFVVGDADVLFSKAFSQILNDICLPNLNVKIIGIQNGETCIENKKIADVLPNMRMMNSSGDDELPETLESMVCGYGPMYLEVP